MVEDRIATEEMARSLEKNDIIKVKAEISNGNTKFDDKGLRSIRRVSRDNCLT